MAIVLSLVVLALLIVAGGVIYAYLPWRKRILIALDPTWRHDARLMRFTPDEEARAAAHPLLARVLVRDACDVIWNEDEDVPAALFGELPYGSLVHVNAR